MPCASIACGFDAMSKLSRSTTIEATAERVFAYVDFVGLSLWRRWLCSRTRQILGSDVLGASDRELA